MSELKPGDVVELNSGGPKMTIETIGGREMLKAHCQWFEGMEVMSGVFPLSSLGKHVPHAPVTRRVGQ